MHFHLSALRRFGHCGSVLASFYTLYNPSFFTVFSARSKCFGVFPNYSSTSPLYGNLVVRGISLRPPGRFLSHTLLILLCNPFVALWRIWTRCCNLVCKRNLSKYSNHGCDVQTTCHI